jgi:hypothetical protein
MEYRQDVRDGLQPIRSFLTRLPVLASLAAAMPFAGATLLAGIWRHDLGTGMTEAFWVLTGGAMVAAWVNRPVVRWLTAPQIVVNLDQPDPDPDGSPASIEILAKRERAFVESHFGLKSDAESLVASGSKRDEVDVGGCWDEEIASVVVARGDFVEAAKALDQVQKGEATPAQKRQLGWMFLLNLHEFIHSATKPGDVPTAWMEGVTELASRTSAAEAVRFTRVKGVDPTFGVKYRDSYDRYVAAMSLVVLELANLTDLPPDLIVRGLVRAGCNPRGVKRFCSAIVRQCRVGSPEVEEKVAKNLLAAFDKLKPGSFWKTKKDDLRDVREALLDLRHDLWCSGITEQPPAIATDDPYRALLQELGLTPPSEEKGQMEAA